MSRGQNRIRAAVKRSHAESYLLTSLVAFAVTVIFTRAFLQLTGFPQIGNSVLHIAHALWGGLLLFVAVLLPLAYANRWAIQSCALLSGIGIGLFIDEVGKFITQANDYFYPPALSLIYGFILLNVFAFLHFRRSPKADARQAMYHALEGLQDSLDNDLDNEKAAQLEAQLAIARQSDRNEIISLANAIGNYLEQEQQQLAVAKPSFWKRITTRVDAIGLRLGQQRHRTFISMLLILWLAFAVGYIAILVLDIPTLDNQVVQWREALIGIQVFVGILMVVAAFNWLTKKEEQGLKIGISGFLLSLVAFQTLYFYLSQFSAITATLLQLAFLWILLAYRRWYLA